MLDKHEVSEMKADRFYSTLMLAEIAFGERDQSDAHQLMHERSKRRERWARRKAFKVTH